MKGGDTSYSDPYAEAFHRLWEARRAGRPDPSIDELLPDQPTAPEPQPGLRLVWSRD